MLDKNKYQLKDENWTFENIQLKVSELLNDIENKPQCDWYHDAYDILSNLWLNRDSSSRFPEWFENLTVPPIFKDIFNDIFSDFDLTYER